MIKFILATKFHLPQKPSSTKLSQNYFYVVTQASTRPFANRKQKHQKARIIMEAKVLSI